MTIDSEVPVDANEADIAEQRQLTVDDGEPMLPDELPLADANPADVLDQYRTVPIDDDDWPDAYGH